jgi:hypothetical protein
MAVGDLFQIPQIIGTLTLQKVNLELRRIWQQINYLAGRNAAPEVRDSLTVSGTVTATTLVADAITVGGHDLTVVERGFDSTAQIPADSMNVSGSLVTTDLLHETSPFTWAIKDEFLGNYNTGIAGDNTWVAANGSISYPTPVANHPGVVQLDNPGGGVVTEMHLSGVWNTDVNYFAAVINPGGGGGSLIRIGLLKTPSSPALGSEGMYFIRDITTSSNWMTFTQNAVTVTQNISTIPATASSWYLLEIVVNIPTTGTSTVDFYINRDRVFRHSGASITNGDVVFPTIVVETIGGARSCQVDTVIASGVVRNKIWS